MTKDEVLAGLQSGRALRCDRRDEPLLPWLLELADQGVVTKEFRDYPEQQYSFLEFRWAGLQEQAK